MPSNEERNGVRIVDRLNREDGGRRMELASRLRDLPEERKASDGSGFEARGPLRQIDRIQDGLATTRLV